MPTLAPASVLPDSIAASVNRRIREERSLATWMLRVINAGESAILTGKDNLARPESYTDAQRVLIAAYPDVRIATGAIRLISDPDALSLLADEHLDAGHTDQATYAAIIINQHAPSTTLRRIWSEAKLDDASSGRILQHSAIRTAEAIDMVREKYGHDDWSAQEIHVMRNKIAAEKNADEASYALHMITETLSVNERGWSSRGKDFFDILGNNIHRLPLVALLSLCAHSYYRVRNAALWTVTASHPDSAEAAITNYLTQPLKPSDRNFAALSEHAHLTPLYHLQRYKNDRVVRHLILVHPDSSLTQVSATLKDFTPDERVEAMSICARYSLNVVTAGWKDRSSRVKDIAHTAAVQVFADEMWNLLDQGERMASIRHCQEPTAILSRIATMSDDDKITAIKAAAQNRGLDGEGTVTVMKAMFDLLPDSEPAFFIRRLVVPGVAEREAPQPALDFIVALDDKDVRYALASEPGLPVATVTVLAADPDPEVREKVSAQLVSAAFG